MAANSEEILANLLKISILPNDDYLPKCYSTGKIHKLSVQMTLKILLNVRVNS